MQSWHKRDVTACDVTTKNQMITGSIDNVLCFWNTFNGTITKKVTVPQTIVKSTGNAIQTIKFADKNSNELLLVFMTHG